MKNDKNTPLNEDAAPSPWSIAIGGGVTLAVVVAVIIREYKKLKQKAVAAGKPVDLALKKTLLLKALSAAANEVQNAR
jgi:hypothetical protein